MIAQKSDLSNFFYLPGGDESNLSNMYLCIYVRSFKGIGDISSPAIPVMSSSLLVSLKCFGVKVR